MSPVPFVALSDPSQLFDGMDQSYPPEKLFAHFSARVTFQLSPQPLNPHACLTWHSRDISLLYCSLKGTASNWYDETPQLHKVVWYSFLQSLKEEFFSKKQAYHAQLEVLALTKKKTKLLDILQSNFDVL